jgi:hypothetical protein
MEGRGQEVEGKGRLLGCFSGSIRPNSPDYSYITDGYSETGKI